MPYITIDSKLFKSEPFPDGAVCLTYGDGGAEVDLVFAQGCMTGDPGLENQQAIIDFLMSAVRAVHKG